MGQDFFGESRGHIGLYNAVPAIFHPGFFVINPLSSSPLCNYELTAVNQNVVTLSKTKKVIEY